MTAARRRLEQALAALGTIDVRSSLAAGAALAGWWTLTAGLAVLAGRYGEAVWYLSSGLALLLCSLGWRVLHVILRDGLYHLSKDGEP